MAETPDNAYFNSSRNALSAEDFKKIVEEREELMRQQLAASNEFMYRHYERLIRAINISYERATHANLIQENKQRRAAAKERRETLRNQSNR